MKKFFVLTLGLLLSVGLFAQSYSDWSRWSVTLEGGFNRFDGDVKQDYGREIIPNAFTKFTPGASLEYTFSPAWSMGVDYYYLPLAAEHRPNNGKGYGFETEMHNASLFTSINAIKLFFPRTTTKWGLWTGAGVGLAWYDVDYKTDNDDGVMVPTKWGLFPDADYKKEDGFTQFIPVHLLAEYNFTKSLALGAKIQYRGFFVDDIDGRFRPNANDALEFATLQLRVKFGAHRKDHTRNVNSATYNGDVTADELFRLHDRINGIVVPLDPTDDLNDLDGRLRKLENYLDIDGPDDDGDGVPNSRDQEPNTPAGNQVDFWGRTIPKAQQGVVFDESALIYFDFDKTNLDDEAHKAIRLAADKLQADPDLIVEVRGYTDNMGTNAYNAGLSQRRADVVKQELVSRYGVDADRIIANGKGKYNPNDTTVPYRLYRTTVFHYNK